MPTRGGLQPYAYAYAYASGLQPFAPQVESPPPRRRAARRRLLGRSRLQVQVAPAGGARRGGRRRWRRPSDACAAARARLVVRGHTHLVQPSARIVAGAEAAEVRRASVACAQERGGRVAEALHRGSQARAAALPAHAACSQPTRRAACPRRVAACPRGLQPAHVGLQPDHVTLQPVCMG